MNRWSICAGLVAAMLAGCASAPPTQDLGSAALGLTGGAAGAAGLVAAAAPQAQASASAAADAEAGEAQSAQVAVVGTVDAQNVHPGSEIICKEMLQHASNVIRRRCMTADAWERYKEAEARRAQAILRAWQGSPYAGF